MRSRITHGLAVAAGLALLATTMAAGASANDCTYTFPDGGGTKATLEDGEVACGGPGEDIVTTMNGGVFDGGGAFDRVMEMNGGHLLWPPW